MKDLPVIVGIFAVWYVGFNDLSLWWIPLCALGFVITNVMLNPMPVLPHEPLARVLVRRTLFASILGVPFMAIHYGIGWGVGKLLS